MDVCYTDGTRIDHISINLFLKLEHLSIMRDLFYQKLITNFYNKIIKTEIRFHRIKQFMCN